MKKFLFIALSAAFCSACAQKADSVSSVELSASFADSSTRTSLVDGGTVLYWEPAEQISVFIDGESAVFISTNTGNVQTAKFRGTISAVMGGGSGFFDGSSLWGLYPYDADAVCDGESVTATLPCEQTGRAGSFAQNTNISVSKSETTALAFYNVCSGLRFSLVNEGVKEVILSGLSGESLAGKVKIAFVDGVPSCEVVEGYKQVKLSAPAGESFLPGKWYYILTLPGTLAEGLRLTFTTTHEQFAVVKSSKSFTLKRGVFGSLAQVDKNLNFMDAVKKPEAVDMGLSVKWADINLGASAPQDYGDYFAWGETECKTVYDWAGYKWTASPAKYNADDAESVLKLSDDAASSLLGVLWRIPTQAQWQELCDNCTWKWTKCNDVNGYTVTSDKNGNSIFLPAAGYRSNGYANSEGSYGSYWSSTLYDGNIKDARRMYFYSGNIYKNNHSARCYGMTIRPVLP